MSDHTVNLGQLLTGPSERDAIHIAVATVCAGEELFPGQNIGFIANDEYTVGKSANLIGIVDPYLTKLVKKGDWFHMLLYPNTIKSLRHEWSHPAFTAKKVPDYVQDQVEDLIYSQKMESITWMKKFANKWNFDYEDLIMAAASPHTDDWGNYVVAQGVDLHSSSELGEDHALFWQHLEVITGKKFDLSHIDKFQWSCSC